MMLVPVQILVLHCFNALISLTAPVTPSNVWTGTEYLGVVGGVQPPTVASANYPVVKCEVNITNSSSGQVPGLIIRQKGSHKFLVSTTAGIDPENAVIGGSPTVALRIRVVGTQIGPQWAHQQVMA
jgi:hypothetical protein